MLSESDPVAHVDVPRVWRVQRDRAPPLVWKSELTRDLVALDLARLVRVGSKDDHAEVLIDHRKLPCQTGHEIIPINGVRGSQILECYDRTVRLIDRLLDIEEVRLILTYDAR